MKLFENKVGRPSNEILKKRKKFYLMVIVSILAVCSISTFIVAKISIDNLMGATTKYPIITQSPLARRVEEYGTYTVNFVIDNSKGKNNIYYRWFTYKDTNTNGIPSYYDKSCTLVSKKSTKYFSPQIKIGNGAALSRSGKLRLYKSKKLCQNDYKGNLKSSSIIRTNLVTFSDIEPVTVDFYEKQKRCLSAEFVGKSSYDYKTINKSRGDNYSVNDKYTCDWKYQINIKNKTNKKYYYKIFKTEDGKYKSVYRGCRNITEGVGEIYEITGNRNLMEYGYKVKVYSSLNSCKNDINASGQKNIVKISNLKVVNANIVNVDDE